MLIWKNIFFSSRTIMEITFTVYPYQINYERKYLKLQDVLGNINGCTDLLFFILQLISKYFSERSFVINISNNFFNNYMIINHNKNNKNESNNSYIKNINFQKFKNESSNKLNNSKLKNNLIGLNNNFLNKSNIKNSINDNTIIQNQKEFSITSNKSFQKKLSYSIFDYCLPFYLMNKMNHKDIIYCYEKILKKYISLEVMIPLLERISKIIDTKNRKNFYFKFDSFFEKKSV